jgi:hypothetical protein
MKHEKNHFTASPKRRELPELFSSNMQEKYSGIANMNKKKHRSFFVVRVDFLSLFCFTLLLSTQNG